MNTRTPGQTARAWMDAYNRHDAGAATELYAEDAVNVQFPWGTSVRGRNDIRNTYLKVFQAFPDIRVDAGNLVAAGPWVAVEWRFRGTMQGSFAGHPATGSPFELRGCELFQISEGLIVVQHGYWDKATLLGQLGLH